MEDGKLRARSVIGRALSMDDAAVYISTDRAEGPKAGGVGFCIRSPRLPRESPRGTTRKRLRATSLPPTPSHISRMRRVYFALARPPRVLMRSRRASTRAPRHDHVSASHIIGHLLLAHSSSLTWARSRRPRGQS